MVNTSRVSGGTVVEWAGHKADGSGFTWDKFLVEDTPSQG